jgi:hypothetical protein
MIAAKECSARWLASGDPIFGEDLAGVWAELGIWRDGAVIKRVPP